MLFLSEKNEQISYSFCGHQNGRAAKPIPIEDLSQDRSFARKRECHTLKISSQTDSAQVTHEVDLESSMRLVSLSEALLQPRSSRQEVGIENREKSPCIFLGPKPGIYNRSPQNRRGTRFMRFRWLLSSVVLQTPSRAHCPLFPSHKPGSLCSLHNCTSSSTILAAQPDR